MKKFLALALALGMILSMAACTQDTGTKSSGSQGTGTQASAAEETAQEDAVSEALSIAGTWVYEQNLDDFFNNVSYSVKNDLISAGVDEEVFSDLTVKFVMDFTDANELTFGYNDASIIDAVEKVFNTMPEDAREDISLDSIVDEIQDSTHSENWNTTMDYTFHNNVLTMMNLESNESMDYPVVLTTTELTIKDPYNPDAVDDGSLLTLPVTLRRLS